MAFYAYTIRRLSQIRRKSKTSEHIELESDSTPTESQASSISGKTKKSFEQLRLRWNVYILGLSAALKRLRPHGKEEVLRKAASCEVLQSTQPEATIREMTLNFQDNLPTRPMPLRSKSCREVIRGISHDATSAAVQLIREKSWSRVKKMQRPDSGIGSSGCSPTPRTSRFVEHFDDELCYRPIYTRNSSRGSSIANRTVASSSWSSFRTRVDSRLRLSFFGSTGNMSAVDGYYSDYSPGATTPGEFLSDEETQVDVVESLFTPNYSLANISSAASDYLEIGPLTVPGQKTPTKSHSPLKPPSTPVLRPVSPKSFTPDMIQQPIGRPDPPASPKHQRLSTPTSSFSLEPPNKENLMGFLLPSPMVPSRGASVPDIVIEMIEPEASPKFRAELGPEIDGRGGSSILSVETEDPSPGKHDDVRIGTEREHLMDSSTGISAGDLHDNLATNNLSRESFGEPLYASISHDGSHSEACSEEENYQCQYPLGPASQIHYQVSTDLQHKPHLYQPSSYLSLPLTPTEDSASEFSTGPGQEAVWNGYYYTYPTASDDLDPPDSGSSPSSEGSSYDSSYWDTSEDGSSERSKEYGKTDGEHQTLPGVFVDVTSHPEVASYAEGTGSLGSLQLSTSGSLELPGANPGLPLPSTSSPTTGYFDIDHSLPAHPIFGHNIPTTVPEEPVAPAPTFQFRTKPLSPIEETEEDEPEPDIYSRILPPAQKEYPVILAEVDEQQGGYASGEVETKLEEPPSEMGYFDYHPYGHQEEEAYQPEASFHHEEEDEQEELEEEGGEEGESEYIYGDEERSEDGDISEEEDSDEDGSYSASNLLDFHPTPQIMITYPGPDDSPKYEDSGYPEPFHAPASFQLEHAFKPRDYIGNLIPQGASVYETSDAGDHQETHTPRFLREPEVVYETSDISETHEEDLEEAQVEPLVYETVGDPVWTVVTPDSGVAVTVHASPQLGYHTEPTYQQDEGHGGYEEYPDDSQYAALAWDEIPPDFDPSGSSLQYSAPHSEHHQELSYFGPSTEDYSQASQHTELAWDQIPPDFYPSGTEQSNSQTGASAQRDEYVDQYKEGEKEYSEASRDSQLAWDQIPPEFDPSLPKVPETHYQTDVFRHGQEHSVPQYGEEEAYSKASEYLQLAWDQIPPELDLPAVENSTVPNEVLTKKKEYESPQEKDHWSYYENSKHSELAWDQIPPDLEPLSSPIEETAQSEEISIQYDYFSQQDEGPEDYAESAHYSKPAWDEITSEFDPSEDRCLISTDKAPAQKQQYSGHRDPAPKNFEPYSELAWDEIPPDFDPSVAQPILHHPQPVHAPKPEPKSDSVPSEPYGYAWDEIAPDFAPPATQEDATGFFHPQSSFHAEPTAGKQGELYTSPQELAWDEIPPDFNPDFAQENGTKFFQQDKDLDRQESESNQSYLAPAVESVKNQPPFPQDQLVSLEAPPKAELAWDEIPPDFDPSIGQPCTPSYQKEPPFPVQVASSGPTFQPAPQAAQPEWDEIAPDLDSQSVSNSAPQSMSQSGVFQPSAPGYGTVSASVTVISEEELAWDEIPPDYIPSSTIQSPVPKPKTQTNFGFQENFSFSGSEPSVKSESKATKEDSSSIFGTLSKQNTLSSQAESNVRPPPGPGTLSKANTFSSQWSEGIASAFTPGTLSKQNTFNSQSDISQSNPPKPGVISKQNTFSSQQSEPTPLLPPPIQISLGQLYEESEEEERVEGFNPNFNFAVSPGAFEDYSLDPFDTAPPEKMAPASSHISLRAENNKASSSNAPGTGGHSAPGGSLATPFSSSPITANNASIQTNGSQFPAKAVTDSASPFDDAPSAFGSFSFGNTNTIKATPSYDSMAPDSAAAMASGPNSPPPQAVNNMSSFSFGGSSGAPHPDYDDDVPPGPGFGSPFATESTAPNPSSFLSAGTPSPPPMPTRSRGAPQAAVIMSGPSINLLSPSIALRGSRSPRPPPTTWLALSERLASRYSRGGRNTTGTGASTPSTAASSEFEFTFSQHIVREGKIIQRATQLVEEHVERKKEKWVVKIIRKIICASEVTEDMVDVNVKGLEAVEEEDRVNEERKRQEEEEKRHWWNVRNASRVRRGAAMVGMQDV